MTKTGQRDTGMNLERKRIAAVVLMQSVMHSQAVVLTAVALMAEVQVHMVAEALAHMVVEIILYLLVQECQHRTSEAQIII